MNVQAKKFNKSGVIKEKHLSLIEYCNLLKSQYRLNNKVLLIQVPQIILKSFNPEVAMKKGYYIFPPAGLQYLYESLKARNLDIRILDLNFEILKMVFEDKTFSSQDWLQILDDYLRDFDASIVGISCMYDLGIQSLIQIVKLLRQRNRAVVILGGIIPSYEWENFLTRDLCHFVVRGEGENKINFLFDNLTEENTNSNPCEGIAYKYNGDLHLTRLRQDQVLPNTDLIDSYSLVKIKEYHKYGSLNPFSRIAGINDSPFSAIQMSRGCRAVCTFCSVRDFMGKGVRKRPVEKVLSEMEFLIAKQGIRHFEWLDDDLLFYRKDFQNLLKAIIDRDWKITWSANNGVIASSLDDQTLSLMRDSGCIGFKIGVETGNPEMLKKIKKPTNHDIFRRTAIVCNRYPEIFVGANFMLGFPGERFLQMMDSFRFHLELNLDWGAFTICQAIRGATAFSDFEDYFDSQINLDGENAKNFIPTRESSRGELSTQNGIVKGLDVFKIDPDCVPTEEQIREIWFAFNLTGNYINNRNLAPGGRVEKFISWVEMAQVAYPTNAYMSLFLSLAYIIKGDRDRSKDYYNKAALCCNTDYWRERFASFGLSEALLNFPRTKGEVFETVENLRKFVSVYC